MCDGKAISKIRLRDYGDCIIPGAYTLHSKFENVLNFTCGSSLVSLVTEDIGSGPVNIVLKDAGMPACEEMVIRQDSIEIGGISYDLSGSERYDSKISCDFCYPDRLKTNLIIFNDTLVSKAHPKSLVFMLDSGREKNFSSDFEAELLKRIKEGYSLIKRADHIAGFSIIKGTGYGLTPAGDDFIAGWLAGSYISGMTTGTDLSQLGDSIYDKCRSDNPVSDTFMYLSKSGNFSQKTKQALFSLIQGEGDAIISDTLDMLSAGETSGADFAAGLACSLDDNIV